MPIALLPSDVVDQIAAGEVVERPAHMVKELVENCLDAGATEIDIDFDLGGREVSVQDNGSGIVNEDLSLAVARHATSKIQQSADIWKIHSYGFRGEALATIAAVSKLTIKSKTASEKLAGVLTVEFGKVGELIRQGGEQGTTVTVRDLFANVPARLKFLKSDAAETAQIKQVLKGLALGNHQVSFRIRQKGKLLFLWPAQKTFQERAEQVLECGGMFRGEHQTGPIHAEVVLAPPQVVERNSRQIWVLVQKRLVQDRSLQTAVMEAYRNLMMHGEYPVAVVNVSCPPDVVDINIHPTKSAVKFQESSQAFSATTRAARQVLERAPWLPPMTATAPAVAIPQAYQAPETQIGWDAPAFQNTIYSSRPTTPAVTMATLAGIAEEKQFPSVVSAATGFWGSLQVLGQANLTYIVAQNGSNLILVDQHAAHERIAFERLMRNWKEGAKDIQTYLLPMEMEFEAAVVESLKRVTEELSQLGVEIEPTSPTSIAVRAAPSLLKESAVSIAIKELAREISENGGSFAFEKSVAEVCASMACHSVVRAGQPLSIEQMRELLVQMDEFPLSSFCPHGRPVSVEFPWTRLEREFGRTV